MGGGFGEVKTGNRIDATDIENLEFLHARLATKGVRCVCCSRRSRISSRPKRRLSDARLSPHLRGHRPPTEDSVPNLPLVLTGPDLSRNFWDEAHPWRWEKRSHAGIFDAALASCERNLGLGRYEPRRGAEGPDFVFEWTIDDSDSELA